VREDAQGAAENDARDQDDTGYLHQARTSDRLPSLGAKSGENDANNEERR
jgi:hypothetical protein